jgi:hypothetical protein
MPLWEKQMNLHQSMKTLVVALAIAITPNFSVLAQSYQFQFGQGQFRFDRNDPRGNVPGKRASCEVYARIAVVQTQANRQFRCNYEGDRWALDPQPHFRWCRWAPRSEVFSEFRERAQSLQRCFDQLGDFDN